jgi:hypothetical protein
MEAASSQPRTGSLADVLDVILDKGIVIDAFVRVSLVGIEIVTIDARIVVASVDTYMHFAREAHRLRLEEGGAHSITRGALRGAGEGLREGLLPQRKESHGGGGVVRRAVGAIRDALTPGDEGDQERATAQDPAPDQGSGGSAQASGRSRQQGRTPAGRSQRTGGRSSGGSTAGGGQETRGGGSSPRTVPSSRRAPSRDRQAP